MRITPGGNPADTDRERLAAEVRRFDSQVATVFLRLLSDYVMHRRDGVIQLQVTIKGGSLSRYSCTPSFTKDLDAECGE